jgi:hypothetical protein
VAVVTVVAVIVVTVMTVVAVVAVVIVVTVLVASPCENPVTVPNLIHFSFLTKVPELRRTFCFFRFQTATKLFLRWKLNTVNLPLNECQ